MWLWIKSCDAWKRVIANVGFEDIETAYTQGFYAGYNSAIKENNIKVSNKKTDRYSRGSTVPHETIDGAATIYKEGESER